jgi:hypothetical protein
MILAVAAAATMATPALAQHEHRPGHGMLVLPGPATTSDAQRAYAEQLEADARAKGARWATRRLARADGYRPIGSRPDTDKHTFHYNNVRRYHDGHRLDPRRPESLVFRQVAPGRFRLVALMFRVPTTIKPPHPAGALLRWHVHYACEMGAMAMAAADNPCEDGMHMRTGPTAMAHVWFVDDIDHAFDLMPPADALLRPTPVK